MYLLRSTWYWQYLNSGRSLPLLFLPDQLLHWQVYSFFTTKVALPATITGTFACVKFPAINAKSWSPYAAYIVVHHRQYWSLLLRSELLPVVPAGSITLSTLFLVSAVPPVVEKAPVNTLPCTVYHLRLLPGQGYLHMHCRMGPGASVHASVIRSGCDALTTVPAKLLCLSGCGKHISRPPGRGSV